MQKAGVWEQIFLRSLTIHEINPENEDCISMLREQLSTIDFLMPESLEPETDFELYVVKKLCNHVDELLGAYLKS